MSIGKKRRMSRQHRRRARMKMRNSGKRNKGVRDHSRPRPNGMKIRVK